MKKCENKDLSFQTKFPNLLSEWDCDKNDFLPSSVFPSARIYVWWKCSKGHQWEARLDSRTNKNRKSGCPFCSGRKVDNSNSLFTLNPNGIMKEWDYNKNTINPKTIASGSNTKVFWKCSSGHEWSARISGRTNGSGCPICSNQKIVTRESCLEITHPQLLKDWNYERNIKKPSEVTYGIKNKVWWKCSSGHEWQSNINSRIKGAGCPYCSGRLACKDNCLSTTHPHLILEWDFDKNGILTPELVTYGSTKNAWWKCKKGHSWKTVIANRASHSNQNGCPYCENKKVCKDNCLATINPSLASEWDYTKNGVLTPDNIVSGSSKKVHWVCKKGHGWFASIASRNYGRECPMCYGIELWDGTCVYSLIEAWYYLFLKNNNIVFEYNKRYDKPGLGRHRFDFYIPEIKTYIEVTGFMSDMRHKSFKYANYLATIDLKRKCVENSGHNFEFIQKQLKRSEIKYAKGSLK